MVWMKLKDTFESHGFGSYIAADTWIRRYNRTAKPEDAVLRRNGFVELHSLERALLLAAAPQSGLTRSDALARMDKERLHRSSTI